MATTHIVMVDLDQLCQEMAHAISELDCPDCCGPVYEFIENGSLLYLEEFQWAVFCECVKRRRLNRAQPSRQDQEQPGS